MKERLNRVKAHGIPWHMQHLVATIERQLGHVLAPTVREAFLHVPRHRFLQQYYEHEQLSTAPSCMDEPAWETWLAGIYRDEALTTHIDARGRPTSSSSQPSVMALMWEHLEVQPGMRLLEIGTGTGYNAALAAVLVGDPSLVSTIDIDPSLVEQARESLTSVIGSGISVMMGNALEGDPSHGVYDRLIATGSTLPVPWAWISQLSSGGQLIMDLRGGLGGGLVVMRKQADGNVVGRFLTACPQISFMPLRSSLEAAGPPPRSKGTQQTPLQEQFVLYERDKAYACAAHFASYERFRGPDDEVNFWLQWAFPGLRIKWKGVSGHLSTHLIDERSQTIVTIEPEGPQMKVQVRGTLPLWSALVSAYEQWIEAGHPGRASATLLIDQTGQHILTERFPHSFLLAGPECQDLYVS